MGENNQVDCILHNTMMAVFEDPKLLEQSRIKLFIQFLMTISKKNNVNEYDIPSICKEYFMLILHSKLKDIKIKDVNIGGFPIEVKLEENNGNLEYSIITQDPYNKEEVLYSCNICINYVTTDIRVLLNYIREFIERNLK